MRSENMAGESRAKKLPMRMHREVPGSCWADSAYLPGYTAVGADFATVMRLVGEALDEPTLLGPPLRAFVDLRWQWCDDPGRPIVAVDPNVGWGSSRPYPCPCASGKMKA